MIPSGTKSGNIKSDDREMFVETSQMKQESRSKLSSDFWGGKSTNHMKIPGERLLEEAGVCKTLKAVRASWPCETSDKNDCS